ncbi:hypothetical protein [Gordonia sihwensis]
MTDTDDAEYGCGYEWDHSLEELDSRDGCVTWVCRECGAEIIEEPDAADA